MKVLIAEDVASFAERVRDVLSEVPGAEVVAVCPTEDQALIACERFAIDLVVVDLQLALGTGFGVIRRLRQAKRPICIVVLTNHAVPALMGPSFEAGADYFLDKAKSKDFDALGTLARELASSLSAALLTASPIARGEGEIQ